MRLIIFFISLISFLLCGYYNTNQDYEYLIFLPLSFLVFNLLAEGAFFNLKKSYVYYIFNIQAIIRYCVIPVGIAYGDTLTTIVYAKNGGTAVFFMLIELLFIFVLFLYQNYKSNKAVVSSKIVLVSKNIWLYIIVAFMFLIILNSNFFNKVNLIWDLSNYVEKVMIGGEEIESGSLGGLLFIPFKVALLLILSSFILNAKINKNIKVFFLVVLIGISASFIVGASRFSIVTFILPFYFILITIFSKKLKTMINVGLLLIIIPVILITSLAKFTRGDKVATTSTILKTDSYNAYFSGVANVAIGIDSFEDLNDKEYSLFFFNDIFQNVPLLSKLTDNKYKSNYVFNETIYGHREWQIQIVPLSIAGLFHFNILGVGIYSCLFLSLAFYYERKAKKEIYLPYKYVFYSLMFALSLVFMFNIGSMIATIVRSFFFIYFPFYMSNRLNNLR